MEENEGCWALSPCKIFESICIKTCTGKEMKSSTYPSENEDTNLLQFNICSFWDLLIATAFESADTQSLLVQGVALPQMQYFPSS